MRDKFNKHFMAEKHLDEKHLTRSVESIETSLDNCSEIALEIAKRIAGNLLARAELDDELVEYLRNKAQSCLGLIANRETMSEEQYTQALEEEMGQIARDMQATARVFEPRINTAREKAKTLVESMK